MSAGDALNSQQFLDLYHRTTPEAAASIYEHGSMASRETTAEAYFSTHRNGEYSTDYGSGVVHVRVPAEHAQLDDEFDDGEQHYRVKVRKLKPQHFIRDDQ